MPKKFYFDSKTQSCTHGHVSSSLFLFLSLSQTLTLSLFPYIAPYRLISIYLAPYIFPFIIPREPSREVTRISRALKFSQNTSPCLSIIEASECEFKRGNEILTSNDRSLTLSCLFSLSQYLSFSLFISLNLYRSLSLFLSQSPFISLFFSLNL